MNFLNLKADVRGLAAVFVSVFMYGTLLLAAYPALAEVYQWRDSHGRLQFSDKPPAELTPNQAVEVRQLEPLPASQSVAPPAFHNSDWRAKEQQAYRNKKQRRLKQERLAKQAKKKKEACKKARSRYRTFQAKPYGSTSLEAIRKKRERRDKLKARMRRACD